MTPNPEIIELIGSLVNAVELLQGLCGNEPEDEADVPEWDQCEAARKSACAFLESHVRETKGFRSNGRERWYEMSRNVNLISEDSFALDDSPSVRGFHDPGVRWNGFACPLFPMDSVREIKAILDQWFDERGEGERIEITDDGRVFTYCDIDRVEIFPSNVLNPKNRDVPLYPIGSHAWVWMEDPTTDDPATEPVGRGDA